MPKVKPYYTSALKVIIIFVALIAGYYFLILAPRVSKIENLSKAEQIISSHHSTLVQNRLAYVELTKLDSASPAFDIEKSNLVSEIKETNQKGLDELNNLTELPNTGKDMLKRSTNLLKDSKVFYENQSMLLERVFVTNSYKEGVEILRSDESIKLITRQTNLILEYQWLLEQLKK